MNKTRRLSLRCNLLQPAATCERVLSNSCVASLKQIVIAIIEANPEEFKAENKLKLIQIFFFSLSIICHSTLGQTRFELLLFSDSIINSTMMAEEGDGGGPAKRRRAFTRRETLEKLEELEGNVAAVVGEIDFGL